ncbi:AAA-associated domain-containing protein [Streptomyces violascens]|uniref:AAA-associated domain-containing protein n=1 Tax=Streptomyces violascens TaxID=67381 RepID=UPI00379CD413
MRNQPDGRVRAGFLRAVLAHLYTSEQIDGQLETDTDWRHYAELYSYDAAPRSTASTTAPWTPPP